MSKRVLCKFFAHGACLKGDHCEFSHDWKAPPNNICTFYQKGACAYGSRCRYDHVKVSRLQASAPSASGDVQLPEVIIPGNVAFGSDEPSASIGSFSSPVSSAWGEISGHNDLLGADESVGHLRSVGPADQSICSFAAAGDCPRGDKCPHIHGDLCPHCGKQCLHPFRSEEREEHLKTCQKRQSQLDALRHSQEIECSVCLERVLSKPTAAERKFGILSECDHAFCISCIRNWRNNPSSGFDINSALRACPICRKLSYFVIPSVIWYTSKEEKQEIVDNYKAKLRSIDCKHFDFGNGSCPFGTSCFYKHTVNPGSFLWNASLNPALYSSGIQNVVEVESSVGNSVFIDFPALLHMYLYSPDIPLENEELENDNEEDLDDIIAEVMALSMQQGDVSDFSNE